MVKIQFFFVYATSRVMALFAFGRAVLIFFGGAVRRQRR